MKTKLIVHGGAWNIPENLLADHLKGVQKAIEAVAPRLEAGMTALEAVEAAVNIMEADPTFDAGRGAFLNAAGEIELDAIIMDGRNLDAGAVAAIQNLLHPVSVARKVMEESEHVLLVGAGAQHFAEKQGFETLDPRELLTERELTFFQSIKDDPDFHTRDPFDQAPMGTVGAVARDKYGNLASATSTGGTPRKLPGRVGDTPIIGAGAYADNISGAVSATGWGEAIMKTLLSKTACDYMVTMPANTAVETAVTLLKDRVNGLGGLIAIDSSGHYGIAFNTPKMARAYIDSDGSIISEID